MSGAGDSVLPPHAPGHLDTPKYRADIDGLRGLVVLSVFGHHAFHYCAHLKKRNFIFRVIKLERITEAAQTGNSLPAIRIHHGTDRSA
jgi:hypothetical protein